jgi:hypothetical protein
MQAVEVSPFWWGLEVVQFQVWCISGSITLWGVRKRPFPRLPEDRDVRLHNRSAHYT